MVYSYVIIEDNAGAAENLRIELGKFAKYKEVGCETTIQKAVQLIVDKSPNLIFLDVELGLESGFDVIKSIAPFFTMPPMVVMTTAFEKYGKQATNHDVLYYLDKPVDPDELKLALAKFEKRFNNQTSRIKIKNAEGHYLISVENIIFIKADNNCAHIVQTNAKNLLVTKTLGDIEKILPDRFLRVHKSFIINPEFVELVNTTSKNIYIRCDSLSEKVISDIRNRNMVEFSNKNGSSDTTGFTRIIIPIGNKYFDKLRNTLLSVE